MQNTEGFDALIGANRGCFAAFAAVYDCPVPLIAAVNGFCVGGGIGLAGNADIVIASDDAFFGLPEVDRGALGAATHLARLVPQHKMRAMVYTGATATAAELHAFGSVLQVVPRDQLRDAAFAVAGDIAAKSPTVMRAAKESLNGIDLWDVKRSYRFEQGFTFELNLAGVSDELRDAAFEVARQIASKSPTVIRAAKESLNGIDLWDVKRSYRFEQGFTFELNLSGVADEHRDAFVANRDTDVSK